MFFQRWLNFLLFLHACYWFLLQIILTFWAIFRRNTCNWSERETSMSFSQTDWLTVFFGLAFFFGRLQRLYLFWEHLSLHRDTMNLFCNRFSSGHYGISLFFYVHLCLNVCWLFQARLLFRLATIISIHSIQATLPSCHLSQKCLIHNLSSFSFDAFRREKEQNRGDDQ